MFQTYVFVSNCPYCGGIGKWRTKAKQVFGGWEISKTKCYVCNRFVHAEFIFTTKILDLKVRSQDD